MAIFNSYVKLPGRVHVSPPCRPTSGLPISHSPQVLLPALASPRGFRNAVEQGLSENSGLFLWVFLV